MFSTIPTTGTSTFSNTAHPERALVAACQPVEVPEYARQFVLEKGAAPVYRDVETIARGQIALEDSLASEASPLLVLDTDLLSTVVYSRHYYGNCPGWVENALGDRGADLYLLAGTDVPWVADGDQRDCAERREEMKELFRRALIERGLRFVKGEVQAVVSAGLGPRRLRTIAGRHAVADLSSMNRGEDAAPLPPYPSS